MSDIPPLDDILVLIEKHAEAGGSSAVAIAAQVLTQFLFEATDRDAALDAANHHLARLSLYIEEREDEDRQDAGTEDEDDEERAWLDRRRKG